MVEQTQQQSPSARDERGLLTSCAPMQSQEEIPDWSPSGVLSQEATRGRFSLQNVLNADESDEQTTVLESNKNDSDDPVVLGLLNMPLAKSLFQR